jgi:hypothetical protein
MVSLQIPKSVASAREDGELRRAIPGDPRLQFKSQCRSIDPKAKLACSSGSKWALPPLETRLIDLLKSVPAIGQAEVQVSFPLRRDLHSQANKPSVGCDTASLTQSAMQSATQSFSVARTML